MLRINVTTQTVGTTVTLEGRVVGAWVHELSVCWRHLLASAVRPIHINLDGVTFIDDGGKAVLRMMHADGGILAASTVMMRALTDDIVAGRDAIRDQAVTRSSRR